MVDGKGWETEVHIKSTNYQTWQWISMTSEGVLHSRKVLKCACTKELVVEVFIWIFSMLCYCFHKEWQNNLFFHRRCYRFQITLMAHTSSSNNFKENNFLTTSVHVHLLRIRHYGTGPNQPNYRNENTCCIRLHLYPQADILETLGRVYIMLYAGFTQLYYLTQAWVSAEIQISQS